VETLSQQLDKVWEAVTKQDKNMKELKEKADKHSKVDYNKIDMGDISEFQKKIE